MRSTFAISAILVVLAIMLVIGVFTSTSESHRYVSCQGGGQIGVDWTDGHDYDIECSRR